MIDNKLVFIDVDGTLVDSVKHIVPKSTITALHKLRENGYLLCIATGRSILSLEESGFDNSLFPWDGYVCNNGQMLYDGKKNRISENYISKEAVQACIETGNQQHSPVLLETVDGTRITMEPNEYVFEAHRFFNEPVPPVQSYKGENIIMMHAYSPRGYDFTPYKAIKGLDVLPGNSTYADIVLAGFTKMNGIEIMLEKLNKNGYIAIGDSLNDIDMMKGSYLSIAVGGAHEKAKETADYVSKEVLEDGIYLALKDLKLID